MDTYLFILINQGLSNVIFDVAMPLITNYGYLLLLAMTIPVFFKDRRKGFLVFTLCILGCVVADYSVDIFKNIFKRPRPYNELKNVILLVPRYGSFSFPSGHSATSFAMASVIFYFFRSAAIPAFIFAAIVAFSRIYVGVHYPSDVLGGAVWGGVAGGIVVYFWKWTEGHFRKSVA